MAMHLRKVHPDKWAGDVTGSFPVGYDAGTPEPRKKSVRAVAKKGGKKDPILQKCPWCKYKSIHPPGLAHHIKATHPKKWKGNLSLSLGRPMTRSDVYLMNKKGVKGNTRSEKWLATRKANLENGHLEDPRGYINHCPECGENLVAYYLAKGAMQRRAEVKV
jgi:ssDNA-binding Zn-finger/Zn-ribbon topoisomerase 1